MIERLRLCLCQSKVTVLSISRLLVVPLHPAFAPLCCFSIRSYTLRCWSMGPRTHEVNHLYDVFKQWIGRWFSLMKSPSLGINLVLPSVNHSGYAHGLLVKVLKADTTPSCRTHARFHQQLTTLSCPGALQFHFFRITLTALFVPRSMSSPALGRGHVD